MDIYEQAVLNYISAPVWRFANPQMALKMVQRGESCPDFVVLDFKSETIYVVEVTAASNTNSHLEKIREREERWYTPLRRIFNEYNHAPFASWKYRVTLFVREDAFEHAQIALRDCEDISVLRLEATIQGWKWNWGKEDMNPLEVALN